jgi:hypothetical protein
LIVLNIFRRLSRCAKKSPPSHVRRCRT